MRKASWLTVGAVLSLASWPLGCNGAVTIGGLDSPDAAGTGHDAELPDVYVAIPSGSSGSTSGSSSSSASTGASGSSGGGGSGGTGPCDILAAAGNPCVAAHSTVRVLYSGYTGPLYQVCNGPAAPGPNGCPSGMSKDIGSVGGYPDTATQDVFCAGVICTVSILYDQSPNHNDLQPSPAGGGAKSTADNPASASARETTLAGHKVYGVLIMPGVGYRAGCVGCGVAMAKGTATGDQPETEYMVTSVQDLIDGCCFDYGNAETGMNDDGNGTVEAVYFGGGVIWGTGSPGGHANGPWVMADLENGLYAGWQTNQNQQTAPTEDISTNMPLGSDFVTAIVVGDVSTANGGMGRFALFGGDATFGTLQTMYDGIRPLNPGYNPPAKQGGIVLGTAGDNSDGAGGRFYEGVVASGAATVETLNALQANILAAGYGQ